MPVEIERKFLVSSDDWRREARSSARLVQGYVANTERCSVRLRVAGEQAWLSLKGVQPGTTRLEFEYPVPVQDAVEILERLCDGTRIEKWRHLVEAGAHCFEVDEFLGDNAGLVVAEVELGAADEFFVRPPWLGVEVTHEARYYNVMLAREPFSTWTPAARDAAQRGRREPAIPGTSR